MDPFPCLDPFTYLFTNTAILSSLCLSGRFSTSISIFLAYAQSIWQYHLVSKPSKRLYIWSLDSVLVQKLHSTNASSSISRSPCSFNTCILLFSLTIEDVPPPVPCKFTPCPSISLTVGILSGDPCLDNFS